MVMSYVICGCYAVSLLVSLCCGRLPMLAGALFDGAASAAELTISLAGTLCLWSGVIRAMDACGISAGLSRLLQPLLRLLFPQAAADPEARSAISANLTANLLGLGNAATPAGIRAVRRMRTQTKSASATDEMCRLIVMNTASVQLLPTTAAALRGSMGAAAPFDILPAVWLTSLISVSAGLLAARLLEGRHG